MKSGASRATPPKTPPMKRRTSLFASEIFIFPLILVSSTIRGTNQTTFQGCTVPLRTVTVC